MKKVLFICLGVVLLFSVTACSSTEKVEGRDIYIPVLAEAAWIKTDSSFLDGVKLAAEEANAEYSGRGFTVRTELVDDKALYETGVEMATSLANDKNVTAVFNLQEFDVSKTTADILAGNGKLVFFPYGAYDSLFKKQNPYLFCGVPAFSDLGRAMADYAAKKGYKRIAVYHNGVQSQEELVNAFELELLNTGSRIVDYVPSISSENDFDNIYSRWQALKVDCVVLTQYGTDRAFEVLRMLREKDGKVPIIGEAVFNRTDILAKNRDIADGMVVPSTLVIDDTDILQAFAKRYFEKYGKDADIWSVQGYDMLRLVVDTAVRLNTNDPARIAEALHDTKGYQGVGRKVAFKEGGALEMDVADLPMLIFKDGWFVRAK